MILVTLGAIVLCTGVAAVVLHVLLLIQAWRALHLADVDMRPEQIVARGEYIGRLGHLGSSLLIVLLGLTVEFLALFANLNFDINNPLAVLVVLAFISPLEILPLIELLHGIHGLIYLRRLRAALLEVRSMSAK